MIVILIKVYFIRVLLQYLQKTVSNDFNCKIVSYNNNKKFCTKIISIFFYLYYKYIFDVCS